MKYCVQCVMPNTRPGIYFDEQGVCQACRAEEQKNKINWNARLQELKILCDKYRRKDDSEFDCIIAVSGGKDSHFQVYFFKEVLGMNPLLVTVEDNFEMTEAGKHNIKNISERFGCHIISLKPNLKAQKHIMRKTFEKYGKPTWFIDRLIYTYPLHIANKFKIPLIVYGENISYEYGGSDRTETYSAKEQINNGVASEIDYNELIDENISLKDLIFCTPPSENDISKLEPIYLSYFTKWNSYANYIFARKNGFKDLTHEWEREHTFENFDQVETPAYLIHPWLKYPKFGHASATDYASKFIRYGLITREEGIQLVKKHDHRVDQKSVQSFIDFLGYSHTDFYNIIDKLYNKKLFNKNQYGEWELKKPHLEVSFKMVNWKNILIKKNNSILQTMRIIESSSLQFAVVVDDEMCLLGTVTDGDIRRGLIKGLQLNTPIQEVMNKKPIFLYSGKRQSYYKSYMERTALRQLPIVDRKKRVEVVLFSDRLQIQTLQKENPVILMAGGLGTRLRPLTNNIPKPMLKVGDKPILEIIIENCKNFGFVNFIIPVNYRKEIIQDYFQEGQHHGVNITYIEETKRLGTAGALSLLTEKPKAPFFVMNGDLLTKINFEQLLDFHNETNSLATMCVRDYEYQIPYGVIKTDNYRLLSIEEKPVHKSFVNAGIYVLNPEIISHIPYNEYLDMPELFRKLISDEKTVTAFPLREYWLDIGQLRDYEKANVEFNEYFIEDENK